MTRIQAEMARRKMKEHGVKFEAGLTDEEVGQIEAMFDFHFPMDYRFFLQLMLPISDRFVSWRLALSSDEERGKIRDRFRYPLDDILWGCE